LVFETFFVHDHFKNFKVLDFGFGLCIWKSWSLYLNGFWRSSYHMRRYLQSCFNTRAIFGWKISVNICWKSHID